MFLDARCLVKTRNKANPFLPQRLLSSGEDRDINKELTGEVLGIEADQIMSHACTNMVECNCNVSKINKENKELSRQVKISDKKKNLV